MWRSTEAFRPETRYQIFDDSTELSEQPASSGIAAVEEAGLAAVMLDPLGKVLCCNSAAVRLFGIPAEPLPGRDIRSLMPDFPFRRATPGYNLAYATFWAAQGEWRRFSGRNARGRLFRIEACLNPDEFRLHHQILLSVRPAREPACETLPRRFAGAPLVGRTDTASASWRAAQLL